MQEIYIKVANGLVTLGDEVTWYSKDFKKFIKGTVEKISYRKNYSWVERENENLLVMTINVYKGQYTYNYSQKVALYNLNNVIKTIQFDPPEASNSDYGSTVTDSNGLLATIE